MFKITILKNGKISNGPAKFETSSEANSWLAKEVANNTFGKPGEYVVEGPFDITAEETAEKAKLEAIKIKKQQAEAELKTFDLNKIKDADVRQIIQFILDKIEAL